MTAFIVRVKDKDGWRDFHVNNWFHRWGADADLKMLPHYANDDPNYTVYGYLTGIGAPFDEAGKGLLKKFPDANMFHGRVVAAKNDVGYEVKILHLLGRDRKTAKYEVFYGDPKELVPLDGKAPPPSKKK